MVMVGYNCRLLEEAQTINGGDLNVLIINVLIPQLPTLSKFFFVSVYSFRGRLGGFRGGC